MDAYKKSKRIRDFCVIMFLICSLVFIENGDEEDYREPQDKDSRFIRTVTYDGGNQIAHPNVQYFENGYLGHKYWMVMTPYTFGEDNVENPSILVSDDGVKWKEPKSIRNPVSGIPPDVKDGGHYSDGYMLPVDQGFEIWFRHNPAREKGGLPNNSRNIIYRITSRDGIRWSDPKTVLDDANHYLSPSILLDGDRYRLWFSNYGGKMYCMESKDLGIWDNLRDIQVNLGAYGPWHQEIIKTDRGYEALILGVTKNFKPSFPGEQPGYRLFYAVSQDGIRFDSVKQFNLSKISQELEGFRFYKSSFVKSQGVYKFYFSVIDKDKAWRLYYRCIPESGLSTLLDDMP